MNITHRFPQRRILQVDKLFFLVELTVCGRKERGVESSACRRLKMGSFVEVGGELTGAWTGEWIM
jgi:hypothetical protein